MFKSLTTIAAIVLVLGLTGCGDDAKSTTTGSATAGAAAGKDTPEGCLAAVKKLFAEAGDDKSPDSLGDEPPPECDGLSADQQQEAVSKAIQSALGDLDTEIEKLDDATEKEVRDALKGTPTP
jgi:hypothetical protein